MQLVITNNNTNCYLRKKKTENPVDKNGKKHYYYKIISLYAFRILQKTKTENIRIVDKNRQ